MGHQNRFWKLFGIEKYHVRNIRKHNKYEQAHKSRDNKARGDAGHVFKFTGELEREDDLKRSYRERAIIPLKKPWYTRISKKKKIPEVEATRFIIDIDRISMEPDDVRRVASALGRDTHSISTIM